MMRALIVAIVLLLIGGGVFWATRPSLPEQLRAAEADFETISRQVERELQADPQYRALMSEWERTLDERKSKVVEDKLVAFIEAYGDRSATYRQQRDRLTELRRRAGLNEPVPGLNPLRSE